MRLPCGIIGGSCSSCPLTECTAGEYGIYDNRPKYDAMGRVSILYDCYTDIEENLKHEIDDPDDYVWPWPLQPEELKPYLEELADKVCTEKQAQIIKLRLKWDKHRAVHLTFNEIGEILGISRQTVTEQFKAGIKRLRKALGEDPLWEDFHDDLHEIIISDNGDSNGR